MDSAQMLAVYTTAWDFTQRMLDAARTEAWDQLIEIGQQRDAQLSMVMQAAMPAITENAVASQMDKLLRNILAADQQIQRLTRNWMDEIQGVMSSVQVEQKLLKAYDPL